MKTFFFHLILQRNNLSLDIVGINEICGKTVYCYNIIIEEEKLIKRKEYI